MVKKMLSIAALLLSFAVFISGCGVSQSNTTQPSSTSQVKSVQYPKELRIGYQKGGNLIILKSSGELEKALAPYNVKVNWVEFAYGPPLLEALNAGKIDLGYTGASPPVFAQAGNGPNLAYVGFGPTSEEGYDIIVPEKSPYKNLAELKGKKIAVAKGSAGHYLLVKAMEKEGLSLEDIEPTYLDYGAARTAFERGDVDAWVVGDPRLADAEESIKARAIVTGKGLPTQYNFYITYRPYGEQYPEVLKIALNELNKSEKRASADLNNTAELLSKDTGIALNVWQRALKRQAWGAQYPLTAQVLESQQQVADTFYNIKQIPKQVNVKDAVLDLK